VGPGYGAHFALGRTEYSASETQIEMVWWAMGAEWADSLGSDIISSSLGYNLFDDPDPDLTYAMLDGHTSVITRAAEIAAAKGILVVVSAGNDGARASVGYKVGAPADANGDSVLAIGAVDSLGFRAAFSSKGPTVDGRIKPDLAAQGVDVIVATGRRQPQLLHPPERHVVLRAPGRRPGRLPHAGAPVVARRVDRAGAQEHGLPCRHARHAHGLGPSRRPRRAALHTRHARRARPARTAVVRERGSESAATRQARRVPPGPRRGGHTRRYRLRVFDAGGRWVRDLAEGNLAPGTTLSIRWNGDDASGRSLAPGLYFLDLESAGQHQTDRVVVLR
jgi:hypothetical protein